MGCKKDWLKLNEASLTTQSEECIIYEPGADDLWYVEGLFAELLLQGMKKHYSIKPLIHSCIFVSEKKLSLFLPFVLFAIIVVSLLSRK